MGAFETFVNSNLGIRKPLILDNGHPTQSSKAAGIIGSEYIDLDTNFLYEKTGENNSQDWVFTRPLGSSNAEIGNVSGALQSQINNVSSDILSSSGSSNQEINNISGELQSQISSVSSDVLSSSGSSTEEVLNVSGFLQSQINDVSNEVFSSSFALTSGVGSVSISFSEINTPSFSAPPQVVVSMSTDSQDLPESFYAYSAYNITATGFNVAFSNQIVEDNLKLDFIIF